MHGFIADTHAVLWFLEDSPRLPRDVHALMKDANNNVVYVSSASIFEIAIKAARGRLKVPPDLPNTLREEHFASLPVTMEHAWHVHELPAVDHLDPFDRMIAAQSLHENLPVISGDAQLDRYGVVRRW